MRKSDVNEIGISQKLQFMQEKLCCNEFLVTDILVFDNLKEENENVVVIPPPASPIEQQQQQQQQQHVVAPNMLRASLDGKLKDADERSL